MMADDLALQGPHPHLANGSRGRSNLLPYQPHGFTLNKGALVVREVWVLKGCQHFELGSGIFEDRKIVSHIHS